MPTYILAVSKEDPTFQSLFLIKDVRVFDDTFNSIDDWNNSPNPLNYVRIIEAVVFGEIQISGNIRVHAFEG